MLCKKQSQWAMCMSMWWVVQVFLQALSEAPELMQRKHLAHEAAPLTRALQAERRMHIQSGYAEDAIKFERNCLRIGKSAGNGCRGWLKAHRTHLRTFHFANVRK